MKLVIASDHAGFALKEEVRAYLTKAGHEIVDLGAFRCEPQDDYPDFAERVGEAIKAGEAPRGILICGSGVGVSIAANKVPGVRAALCGDAETAAGARTWNDANVLALSLRATSIPIAKAMLDAWFGAAPTADPKYAAMIEQIQSTDLPVSRT